MMRRLVWEKLMREIPEGNLKKGNRGNSCNLFVRVQTWTKHKLHEISTNYLVRKQLTSAQFNFGSRSFIVVI
jgi:hypothetical protein